MRKTKLNSIVDRHQPILIACLLSVVLLFSWQNAYPQEKATKVTPKEKINVSFTNASLEDVLLHLKSNANYYILYNSNIIKGVMVSIKLKDATITQVMDACLKGTNLEYTIKDDTIVVRAKKERASKDKVSTPEPSKEDEITISGIITTESNGEPLAGVSISVKGSTIGVLTNSHGEYKLTYVRKHANEEITLFVSLIGMKSQEILYTGQKSLNIQMEDLSGSINEVVVTGYATFDRGKFTGSATTVSQEDILKVSKTDVLTAIQAYDPSFRVLQNNAFGSDPNAVPEVYIRGRSGIGVKELDVSADQYTSKANLSHNPNLPTFILDGFEVSVEKIYDLDPNRIESVTILKDAAATAMYGSRAANGVVVITTVTPKPGDLRISYNFTGTAAFPDLSEYNLANAREKLEIERLSGLYDAETPGEVLLRQNEYSKRLAMIARDVDTDWLRMPLRNTFSHKHSLGFEGGSESLRYGIDFLYNNENGAMKKTYRDRVGGSFYVDFRFKNLQVTNEISYFNTSTQESPYGSFSDFVHMQPYDRVYDDNGQLLRELEFSMLRNNSVNNPLYEASLANEEWSKNDEFINNLRVQWYPLSSLTVRAQITAGKTYNKSERFIDPLSSKVSIVGNDAMGLTGDLYTTSSENTTWRTNFTANYVQSINKHNFNALLGVELSSVESSGTRAHYRGFPSGELSSPSYAAEIYSKPSRVHNLSRLFGTLATFNYTYDNIYLFDLSGRIDGSSMFGSNQSWAPFWSTGFGINIHKYKFIERWNIFSELRAKVSYGETGKTSFAPYLAKTTYSALTDDWYITGYGVALKAMGNKNLSWEVTQKLNTGIDMALFDNRALLNFTYYREKTVDLVNDVTIASSNGFTSYADNFGEVLNHGIEVNLRVDVIRNKNMLISLWGNMAHNKEKLLKISESLKDYNDKVGEYYKQAEDAQAIENPIYDPKYAKPLNKYEEGASMTSIWGVRSLGIDPTTGKEIFLNRDGTPSYVWSASQQEVLGNTEPKVSGSFGITASYKRFSLFMAFRYSIGAQIYNQTLVDFVENADVKNMNVDKRVLTDRWQSPGDISPLKDIRDRSITTLPSSRFVQNDDQLVLSSITLGYDFDIKLLKKTGLKQLRIELQTNELFRAYSARMERGTQFPFTRQFNISVKTSF